MATYHHYRVLIEIGEIEQLAGLPLAPADNDHGHDVAGNQEYCGPGCEGDFIGGDDNGRNGDVWEFVTIGEVDSILNSNPAVIAYKQVF